jgi:PST family polysaccharide transporter
VTLLKSSAINGLAVGVRMATAFGLNKVLALAVGPSGYAVIGHFQNAVSMLTTAAGGAIAAGVTKFTAEYADDETRQRAVWRTAGSISTWFTVVTSVITILLSRQLAGWLLDNTDFAGVFIWLGAALGLLTLNSLLLAILNGKKETGRYVTIAILASIIGLLGTGTLALLGGLYGALVALAINQAIVVLVTLCVCFRAPWFRIRYLWGKIDPAVARNLGKYALMALTSATVVPVTQILIRNHLAERFGWEAAGHWQAVSKISELYLMLIVNTLSLYYLPRLAQIKSSNELKREIRDTYKIVLPVTIIGAAAIWALRNFIVVMLFAPGFLPMTNLFPWQLLGDIMKIGSWILAYIMIGQSLPRTYIVTEVVFCGLHLMLVWLTTQTFGLRGAPIAYAICYALYWITMLRVVSSHLRRMEIQAPKALAAA